MTTTTLILHHQRDDALSKRSPIEIEGFHGGGGGGCQVRKEVFIPLLGFCRLAGLVFVILPFLVREVVISNDDFIIVDMNKKSVQTIHGMSVRGRQVGEGLVQSRMGRTKTGHGRSVVVVRVVVGVRKTSCGIVVCIHVIVHDSSHCCC